MKHVHDAAANNVGVSIRQRKDPITFDQYQLNRLGKYRQDTAIATASAYTHTRTTVKWPFVWDYLGELIRDETVAHSHPSCSSDILYLLRSTASSVFSSGACVYSAKVVLNCIWMIK